MQRCFLETAFFSVYLHYMTFTDGVVIAIGLLNHTLTMKVQRIQSFQKQLIFLTLLPF